MWGDGANTIKMGNLQWENLKKNIQIKEKSSRYQADLLIFFKVLGRSADILKVLGRPADILKVLGRPADILKSIRQTC